MASQSTNKAIEAKGQEEQLRLFCMAVDLVGGQRAASRLLKLTSDRTIRRLCAGESPLHTGWLQDMAALLADHARMCNYVERELNPIYMANRTIEQRHETVNHRRRPAQHHIGNEDQDHG